MRRNGFDLLFQVKLSS